MPDRPSTLNEQMIELRRAQAELGSRLLATAPGRALAWLTGRVARLLSPKEPHG